MDAPTADCVRVPRSLRKSAPRRRSGAELVAMSPHLYPIEWVKLYRLFLGSYVHPNGWLKAFIYTLILRLQVGECSSRQVRANDSGFAVKTKGRIKASVWLYAEEDTP